MMENVIEDSKSQQLWKDEVRERGWDGRAGAFPGGALRGLKRWRALAAGRSLLTSA